MSYQEVENFGVPAPGSVASVVSSKSVGTSTTASSPQDNKHEVKLLDREIQAVVTKHSDLLSKSFK